MRANRKLVASLKTVEALATIARGYLAQQVLAVMDARVKEAWEEYQSCDQSEAQYAAGAHLEAKRARNEVRRLLRPARRGTR